MALAVATMLKKGQGEQLLGVVEVGFSLAAKMFMHGEGWQGRTGGVFCIGELLNGATIFERLVGVIQEPDTTRAQRKGVAEKMVRLANRLGYASSYTSRDLPSNTGGGAIMTGNHILGLEGLPELGNEAVVLTAAVATNELSLPSAETVVAMTNNQYFHRLYDAVRQELANPKPRRGFMFMD